MGSYIGAWKTAARKTGKEDAPSYLAAKDSGWKWCRLCRAWQPKAVFAHDRTRYDGLSAACGESRNARARALYRPAADRRTSPVTRPTTTTLKALAVLTLALLCTGCASLSPQDETALVAYDRAARLHLVESRYQRSRVMDFTDETIRIR